MSARCCTHPPTAAGANGYMTSNDDPSELSRRLRAGMRPIPGRQIQEAPSMGSASVDGETGSGFVERRNGVRRGRRTSDPAGGPVKTPPVLIATADESLSRMLAFALEQMRLE